MKHVTDDYELIIRHGVSLRVGAPMEGCGISRGLKEIRDGNPLVHLRLGPGILCTDHVRMPVTRWTRVHNAPMSTASLPERECARRL
jgi:hypothetical protein